MNGHDESVSRIDGPAEGEGGTEESSWEGCGKRDKNLRINPNGRSCQLLREGATVVRVALFMYVKSLVTQKYCPIVKQILSVSYQPTITNCDS